MAREQAHVGTVFLVLRKADDFLNRGGLALGHGSACAERRSRDLKQPAVVPVADHAHLRGHPLFDVHRLAVPQDLRAVQGQVRLPLDLVHAPEDGPACLVFDLHELVPLDRFDDGEAEGRRADVAIDHTDKSIAMVVARGPRMTGGIHACIPCAAR